MNLPDAPGPPAAPCVADLTTTPTLWPWPDCCYVRFEILDLNVEATVHSTRELALQLSDAASVALREWVGQSAVYDLALSGEAEHRFAATTFNGTRVVAAMHNEDWASALFDAIIPVVFSQLLGLPLSEIEFVGLPPAMLP